MATVKKCQHLFISSGSTHVSALISRPISTVTMKIKQQNDFLSYVPPLLLDIRDYHK